MSTRSTTLGLGQVDMYYQDTNSARLYAIIVRRIINGYHIHVAQAQAQAQAT